MFTQIISNDEVIGTCLNGEPILSIGTLELRWKGKSFRKIINTVFHVINGDLPWEVVLGSKTIDEHRILEFAGFGALAVLPKKTKGTPISHRLYPFRLMRYAEEKSKEAERKREQKKKVEANRAKVEAHERMKNDAAYASSSNSGSSGSSRH
jgi:hypothetical protein